MKILHVVGLGVVPRDPEGSPVQGVARVALELARAQVERGHDVWVVGADPDGWRSSWKGVRTVGLRVASWAHLRWGRRQYDLRLWIPLALFTRRRRFDVIHTHGLDHFAPLGSRVRIAHVHNDPLWDDTKESLRAQVSQFRRLARGTRAQIAVSEYVADRLRCGLLEAGGGVPLPARIRVVPNAVDHERFDRAELPEQRRKVRAKWGFGPNDVVFLFTGAFVREKGLDTLARAFKGCLEERSSVRLVLAGGPGLWGGGVTPESTDSDNLEREVVTVLEREIRHGLVRFHGMVASSALPGIYAASDVVVCPSRVQEAFGLSALEAMAAGRPVIASAVGGLPELLDERTGCLVPAGDASALRASMERLADDPELRRRLGENAAERAGKYSWEAAAREVEDLYKEILCPRGSRRRRA